MITTIKHTFLPLPHAYAQIHHNFKKKNQYSQLYTKQKNYGWASCLQTSFLFQPKSKNTFSSEQCTDNV